MRRLLVVIAVLAASATAGAARGPNARFISWADARHGWVPDHEYASWCRAGGVDVVGAGGARLCATDDGGKTWRSIFIGGNYVFNAVRTSRSAGIVSTGAHGHVEYLTVDGGASWERTDAVCPYDGLNPPPMSIVGRGSFLFCATGDTVYRILGWPPRPASAPLEQTPATRVPEADFARLARIARGFVAVFDRGGELVVAVSRDGAVVTRTLAIPPGQQTGRTILWRLTPGYPVLAVEARIDDGQNRYRAVWRSRDGGRTWHYSVADARA